jgi:DNA invertase Pin-like site-specific DNA recombinase
MTPDLPPPEGYLLLRKSRRKEEQNDPEALEKHRGALLRLAEQDGVSIPPEHIIAEVKSGESLAGRPAFSAWLHRISKHPPAYGGLLYSVDVDRISRGVASERGYIQEALLAAGIKVRTPAGLTDLANPEETLLYELRGSLSRLELQKYKQRVTAARNEMTRTGKLCTGRPAWGYDWDKNQQQPVPDSQRFPILQALCREIFDTSALALSQRYGLSHTTVWKALSNPMICGYPCRRYRTTTTRSGERRPVLLPREQWVWPEQPGTYPVACSRDEWEAIQIVLQQRWSLAGKSGFDAEGWCRDVLLFRGYSERPRLSGRYQHAGRTLLTYALDRKVTNGNIYIRRDVVHRAVETALRDALTDEDSGLPPDPASGGVAGSNGAVRGSDAVLDGIRQELERERRQLADLMRLWAGADEEERLAIRTTQAAVKRRLADLKREIQAAHAPVAAPLDLQPLLPHLALLAADWELEWDPTPGEVKRQIVRLCVLEVEAIVAPVPGRSHWLREVGEVRLQDWLGEKNS